MTDQKQRILIFTGDGKGKTTAAIGMAMRAAGHGLRVLVVQFVKNDDTTGELASAGKFDSFKIVQGGMGFVPPDSSPEFQKHKDAARSAFQVVEKAVTEGSVDVLVMDEICFAVARKLVDESAVIELLKRTEGLRAVAMTGRGATQGLIDAADTVTEMKCIKHGYESGRKALEGVEY